MATIARKVSKNRCWQLADGFVVLCNVVVNNHYTTFLAIIGKQVGMGCECGSLNTILRYVKDVKDNL